MKASSKVSGSRGEVIGCDALPSTKALLNTSVCVCVCVGKLICNSVGGAIVTGFLRLNDGENKE